MTKAKNAAPAMSLYTTQSSLEKAIVAMHGAGQSLQTEMHKIACSVLLHVGKHSDTRVVQKFVLSMTEAMPDMARTNALRDWFCAFGPIMFDGKDVLFTRTGPTEGKVKMADAMAKPFWKFKANEGGAYVPLDVAAQLSALVKKIQKDAEKTGADHSKVLIALRNAALGTAPAAVQ